MIYIFGEYIAHPHYSSREFTPNVAFKKKNSRMFVVCFLQGHIGAKNLPPVSLETPREDEESNDDESPIWRREFEPR